jgi:hypothetical protein
MRAVLVLALALALPPKVTLIASGVDGEDLADAPVTDVINLDEGGPHTVQLSLTLAVTPGTSTRVRVACYQSMISTGAFGAVPLCDVASPSTCVPDVREFTLSDYAAVSGVKYINTNWLIPQQFAKCSADDPDDGSGTVVITGSRSVP